MITFAVVIGVVGGSGLRLGGTELESMDAWDRCAFIHILRASVFNKPIPRCPSEPRTRTLTGPDGRHSRQDMHGYRREYICRRTAASGEGPLGQVIQRLLVYLEAMLWTGR